LIKSKRNTIKRNPFAKETQRLEAKRKIFVRKLQGKNGDLWGQEEGYSKVRRKRPKRIAERIANYQGEDQLLKLQELNQYQLWLF